MLDTHRKCRREREELESAYAAMKADNLRMREKLTNVRPVVDAASEVVAVWRKWQRRIEGGSPEQPPLIPIKALALAVDVLAFKPAADALTADSRAGQAGGEDDRG